MMSETKIYKTTAKAVLESRIPFNSMFDETLRDEDLRITKTKCIDESNDEYEDWDYIDTEIKIDYKLECLTARLTRPDAEWESIIAYPRFASGSKTRNEFYRIQDQVKTLINKNN